MLGNGCDIVGVLTGHKSPAEEAGGGLMSRHLLVVVVLLSAVVIAGTRLPTRSLTLWSWDSVNFALAMDHIDIRAHQPHPPGYLAYVFAARLAHLAVRDENLAMLTVNLVAAVLICVLLFRFAWVASAASRRLASAWTSWAVLVASPLFWFYTVVAEISVSEMLASLLVAYCCYRLRQGSERHVYFLAIALAYAAAVKLPVMVLLLPLAGYCLVAAPLRRKWRTVCLLALLLALWFLPLMLAFGGVADYIRFNWAQLVSSTEATRVAGRGLLRPLNRNARDTFYSLVAGLGLVNAAVLLGAGLAALIRRRLGRPASSALLFGSLWVGPFVLVFVLLHISKFGYALPLLAPLALAIGLLYARLTDRRLLVGLVLMQALAGSWQFLYAGPFSSAMTGGDRAYATKTMSQQFFTELGSLLRTTRPVIQESDANLLWIREMVAKRSAEAGASAIVTGNGLLNWRRAMYYFPDLLVIGLPDEANAFMVAEGRRAQPAAGTVAVAARTVFWLLPPNSDVIRQLETQGLNSVGDDTRMIFWTERPVAVVLPGATLDIR